MRFDSFNNYNRTVINGIEKERLKEFDDNQGLLRNVFKQYKDKNEKLRLWGIKSDKLTRWNKIKPGDIIFFYRNKCIVSWCRVLDKFEEENVATTLWGSFVGKHYPRYTWPLIIVLNEPNHCNIPFSVFSKILGYADNYFLRSFFKLNERLNSAIEANYKNIEEFVSKESIKN